MSVQRVWAGEGKEREDEEESGRGGFLLLVLDMNKRNFERWLLQVALMFFVRLSVQDRL